MMPGQKRATRHSKAIHSASPRPRRKPKRSRVVTSYTPFLDSSDPPSQRTADSDPPGKDEDEGKFFPARAILAERRTARGVEYLIDWEDVAGQRYSPTWESESKANSPLKDEWEQTRTSKAGAERNSASPAAQPHHGTRPQRSPTQPCPPTSKPFPNALPITASSPSLPPSPHPPPPPPPPPLQSVPLPRPRRRALRVIQSTSSVEPSSPHTPPPTLPHPVTSPYSSTPPSPASSPLQLPPSPTPPREVSKILHLASNPLSSSSAPTSHISRSRAIGVSPRVVIPHRSPSILPSFTHVSQEFPLSAAHTQSTVFGLVRDSSAAAALSSPRSVSEKNRLPAVVPVSQSLDLSSNRTSNEDPSSIGTRVADSGHQAIEAEPPSVNNTSSSLSKTAAFHIPDSNSVGSQTSPTGSCLREFVQASVSSVHTNHFHPQPSSPAHQLLPAHTVSGTEVGQETSSEAEDLLKVTTQPQQSLLESPSSLPASIHSLHSPPQHPSNNSPVSLLHSPINNTASSTEADDALISGRQRLLSPFGIKPTSIPHPSKQILPITMPETRRSSKVNGQANSAAPEENEPVLRKNLRSTRNEGKNKADEVKAKLFKQRAQEALKKAIDSEANPLKRSESGAESETASSNATKKTKGRPRKSNVKVVNAEASATGTAPSARASTSPGRGRGGSNGNKSTKATPKASPKTSPKMSPEPARRDGKMEFVAALPLTNNAAVRYKEKITISRMWIEEFTDQKTPSAEDVENAEELLHVLRKLVMHPDLCLPIDHADSMIAPEHQNHWDVTVSAKFKFLHTLIEAMRQEDAHIALVTKPGRLMDMLENFLLGSHVHYYRPDKQTSNDAKMAFLRFTLFSSHPDAPHEAMSSADLVINFDLDMDTNADWLNTLRDVHGSNHPLVSLASINTIDHIEYSFSKQWSGIKKLQALVYCVSRLRLAAGKVDPALHGIEESARAVAEFVQTRGGEGAWPMAPLGPLADMDSWQMALGDESLLLTAPLAKASGHSNKSSANSQKSSTNGAKLATAAGVKRAFDLGPDWSGGSARKKRRLSDEDEMDYSLTRVSDTMLSQSQASSLSQAVAVSDEVLKLRVQLKEMEKKAQLAHDWEQALNELQFRFEDVSAEKRQLKQDLEDVMERNGEAEKLLARKDEMVTKLQDENAYLKGQLEEARKQVAYHAVPEVAELEKWRKEKDDAIQAKVKAERQVAEKETLMNYIKSEWTTATSRVRDLMQDNNSLGSTIEDLERRVSSDAKVLKERVVMDKWTRIRDENMNLKQQIKSRDLLLEVKEKQIHDLKQVPKRPGVATRSNSVGPPKSPKVGANSRAGSPTPTAPQVKRIENIKNSFNGVRRQIKPIIPEERNLSPPAAQQQAVVPKAAEPEPQKVIETRLADSKAAEQRLPDLQPAQPKPAVIEVKTGTSTSRPFPCCFAPYNCPASFTSKNEWKRHISTKHIQLGFWRCDMCNPSPGLDHPVFNDFNRKDLFTQHLRRMHNGGPVPNSGRNGPSTPGSQGGDALSEETIADIQKRCYRVLRAPPQVSSCVFCARNFTGQNSWEERLEHVGGHLERDRKNCTSCAEPSQWREDPPLRNYLLMEGIIEQDQRGGYRIGDGRPRRPLDSVDASTSGGSVGGSAQLPIVVDADSEGSIGKRRRGRPPKRFNDMESPLRMSSSAQHTPRHDNTPSGPPSRSRHSDSHQQHHHTPPGPPQQPDHRDATSMLQPRSAPQLQPRLDRRMQVDHQQQQTQQHSPMQLDPSLHTPGGAQHAPPPPPPPPPRPIRDGVSTRSQAHPQRLEPYPPPQTPQAHLQQHSPHARVSPHQGPGPGTQAQQHQPADMRDGVSTRSQSILPRIMPQPPQQQQQQQQQQQPQQQQQLGPVQGGPPPPQSQQQQQQQQQGHAPPPHHLGRQQLLPAPPHAPPPPPPGAHALYAHAHPGHGPPPPHPPPPPHGDVMQGIQMGPGPGMGAVGQVGAQGGGRRTSGGGVGEDDGRMVTRRRTFREVIL